MKKTIITLTSIMFLMSCGSSTETDTITVGTDGSVDTLQPFYDSVTHIQDSLIELDTNNYVERFGTKIKK